jgi:acyl carrier protein
VKKKGRVVEAERKGLDLSVLDQVRMVVAEQKRLAMESVAHEAVLVAGLSCDQLDRVEIQMELEQRFGIRLLPDIEVDRCKTVGELADLVVKYGGSTHGEAVAA